LKPSEKIQALHPQNGTVHPHWIYKRYTDFLPTSAHPKSLKQWICVTFPFFQKETISDRDVFSLNKFLKMFDELSFSVMIGK
jgi:hypothetical protein